MWNLMWHGIHMIDILTILILLVHKHKMFPFFKIFCFVVWHHHEIALWWLLLISRYLMFWDIILNRTLLDISLLINLLWIRIQSICLLTLSHLLCCIDVFVSKWFFEWILWYLLCIASYYLQIVIFFLILFQLGSLWSFFFFARLQ